MKKLIENTALISGYIILCGAIKYYIYYKKFGILIFQFIGLQEILTLFLENLFAYLAISVFIIFNVYLIFGKTSINKYEKAAIKTILLKKWYLPLLIVVLNLGYFRANVGIDLCDFLILTFASTIIWIAHPYLFIHLNYFLERCFKKHFNKTETTGVVLAVLLFMCAITNGFNEARKVKKHNNVYFNAEIKLKEKKLITSNDTVTFVGMTNNYLFLYNKFSKVCTVLKTEDLEFINFP